MVHDTIIQEGFECDYVREGWVQVHDEDEQTKLDDSVRMAIDTGFTDWCKITPDEVERISGMKVRHNAGFSLAAASFHPAKWCWSLLKYGIDAGKLRFYSRTKVTRVEDVGDALGMTLGCDGACVGLGVGHACALHATTFTSSPGQARYT